VTALACTPGLRDSLAAIQGSDDVVQRMGGVDRPARFWGLALRVENLDQTVELLGARAGPIRPAVQPVGASRAVSRSAGLAVPLALISAFLPC
jgi:hypothetical protein